MVVRVDRMSRTQVYTGCIVKRKNDPNQVKMSYKVTELIVFIDNEKQTVKASAFITPIKEYEIPGGGRYLTNTSSEVDVLDLIVQKEGALDE